MGCIPIGVTSIGDVAFGHCINLTNVYYDGSRTQWNGISMGENNDFLTEAEVLCYAVDIPAQPADQNIVQGKQAQFTVEAYHDCALTYQWQYSKDGGKSWYNSSSATQGYNADTLTVASVSGSTNRNGFLYRCIITDIYGNRIESQPATLTAE